MVFLGKVYLSLCFTENSPMAYDFAGLMSNEFVNFNLTCTGTSLIPNGPTYTDIAHQVCSLAGAITGTDIVVGRDYISQTFNYIPSQLWRNFGIILAFTAVFMVLNGLLSEVILYGASGRTITFFQKENEERKELNEALLKKRSERRRSDADSNDDTHKLQIDSKRILTWEALNYDVPVKGKQIRLLNDIYGYVKPGELTALMGASGAGKTTLLDVLADRKNVGIITGDVFIDGSPRGIEFQRGTAYCEQLDVHEDTQTVREALRFSAYLRQPYHVSKEEKDAYVEQVITLLEMENIADAMIGNPVVGLSVAERKRVTIGVELAAKPELLLFLDEPSSGIF
jgi:ATP-binding cassette, subfamily G (WHITE), member 2, SNQ2